MALYNNYAVQNIGIPLHKNGQNIKYFVGKDNIISHENVPLLQAI